MFEGECAPYSGGKSLFLHAKKEEKSQFCVAATSKKDPAIVRFMGDCEADDSLPTVVVGRMKSLHAVLSPERVYLFIYMLQRFCMKHMRYCDVLQQYLLT